MKIFASVILAVMISTSAFAAPPAEEQPWASILICTDTKTGKMVLTEKSLGRYSFRSPTYAEVTDLTTRGTVYIFSMGADIICKFMDKKTYESRR